VYASPSKIALPAATSASGVLVTGCARFARSEYYDSSPGFLRSRSHKRVYAKPNRWVSYAFTDSPRNVMYGGGLLTREPSP
jgi:hypothetical protein